MSDKSTNMSDEFWKTIGEFLSVAERLEGQLTKAQIHSAFLYASAIYSAKFLTDPQIQHKKTTDHLVAEYVDIYGKMLREGVSHYNGKPSA